MKKEADYHPLRELVNIRTYSAINGRKNFQGTLLELKDGDVFVDVDGQPVAIPLAMISKARLAVEF